METDDRNLGDVAHRENWHRNVHVNIFVGSDDRLAYGQLYVPDNLYILSCVDTVVYEGKCLNVLNSCQYKYHLEDKPPDVHIDEDVAHP